MQSAQVYLEVVKNRGERGLELERVYRNLQNKELFLMAYAKLYTNEGGLTPGIDPSDTVDDMSLARIDRIIEALEAGTYRWKPTRRMYIPKNNGKLRPLSIPGWNDKLLEEVIRTVLSAYYEPQFSDASHGFRPGRGCHTALQSILFQWKGTKWFIEGDIKGCYDHISRNKLLEIIGRSIKDDRLLKLLKGMLDAGYLEDWKYHTTFSGTPQGGVLSPLLANIFLNELDTYIEKVIIPQYNKGESRRHNSEYTKVEWALRRAKKQGEVEQYKALDKERKELPYGDPKDPNFRRLKYVRYADDFVLGFVGPKSEAEEIKRKIGNFLKTLGLELSEEKTLITNATEERARFLGYDVYVAQANSRRWEKRRSINGQPLLSVPPEVVQEWSTRYTKDGKPYHRTELLNHSEYDIVTDYNLEFQGLANYYTMAYDVATKLYPVKWIYLQSLVKTLAYKRKRPATWVYRQYRRKLDNGITAIVVEVPREGRKPLVARFGAKPIRFNKKAVVEDAKPHLWNRRNELVKRLTANVCELCGSTEDIRVHHIHKLKDIQQKYQGRGDPPEWAVKMMELRRKTLVVCTRCHQKIHAGTYDGGRLK